MTPQLQQAIKLLQLPAVDLQSFVAQELLDNPFLSDEDSNSEVAAESKESGPVDSAEALSSGEMSDDQPLDFEWDSMYDSGRGASTGALPDDEQAWESMATTETSLKDHLLDQLSAIATHPVENFLCRYLIDAIDDSGYLRVDLKEAVKKLSVDPEKMEDALYVLQSLDPAGIGARDLAECLKLQLGQDRTPAEDAILNNLDLLAQRDVKTLMKLSGCDEEAVREAMETITTLNPKPGMQFGRGNADTVVPDVVVRRKEGQWHVELNAEAMPKVLLNRHAAGLVEGAKGDAKSYASERLGRAKWLLNSLEQRARTILKVSRVIVQTQQGFFESGVEALVPLTLKQVADVAEVHESTVSRVTSGKFMQTPMGTFELKYFFSAAINTTGGQVTIAAAGVKAMIKKLIDAEEPTKPLSDEKIVSLLQDEGVDIARRTVAKYREALGIMSSSKRRKKG